MIFRFLYPAILFLLLLIPLMAFLKGRYGKGASILFSSTTNLKEYLREKKSRAGGVLMALRFLTLALLIVALARPQYGDQKTVLESSGIDIVLAVDVSTSMWAHDFEVDGRSVDRLTVVKEVVENFINKRANDRLGLLIYAGNPYLVSPLTLDHSWLLKNLDRVEIGMVEDGTAIGSAIGSASNRLVSQETKSKVIILLTDGANNRGTLTPDVAANAAKALGIRIYTIGVGREGYVPFPRLHPVTGEPIIRNGQYVFAQALSDIDLDQLRRIADTTEGRFFHAQSTESLSEIYEEIDRLERSEIRIDANVNFNDTYHWWLWAGFAFFLLERLLATTIYRRVP